MNRSGIMPGLFLFAECGLAAELAMKGKLINLSIRRDIVTVVLPVYIILAVLRNLIARQRLCLMCRD
jgi:hypothetical protein